MTISRTQVPYVTMKNAAEAIRSCFGTYEAAAKATGYRVTQLSSWASRRVMPRPVYDRLAKTSPTPFPRFGRTKWVKGGRNFTGPDTVESSETVVSPTASRRSIKATVTPVRPQVAVTTTTSATALDPLAALQQLIGEMQQTKVENEQLKTKLNALREALV